MFSDRGNLEVCDREEEGRKLNSSCLLLIDTGSVLGSDCVHGLLPE